MAENLKMKLYCAGAVFKNMGDRFVSDGYKPELVVPDLEKKLEIFAEIGGMAAISASAYLGQPLPDPIAFKELVGKYGFRVGGATTNNYTKAHWKYGTFAARDPQTRRDIVDLAKRHVDWAAAVMLWNACSGWPTTATTTPSRTTTKITTSIWQTASQRWPVTTRM